LETEYEEKAKENQVLTFTLF